MYTADTKSLAESTQAKIGDFYSSIDAALEVLTGKAAEPHPHLLVPSESWRRVLTGSFACGNSAVPFFNHFYNSMRDFKSIFQLKLQMSRSTPALLRNVWRFTWLHVITSTTSCACYMGKMTCGDIMPPTT